MDRGPAVSPAVGQGEGGAAHSARLWRPSLLNRQEPRWTACNREATALKKIQEGDVTEMRGTAGTVAGSPLHHIPMRDVGKELVHPSPIINTIIS